ncbi:hypothetical protein [Mycobacteroides abscessus]|uniref:hypothetical protein n=1 Tax=Mycobacteroides abscessus TaxID=36809 RepID=UPI00267020DE|nr:hypothetical protein [Mycobacteroides abscessus]MDO3110468.1 hypothetical protein [Mycobacteroides abscessus subsp. abscessus]
MSTPETERLAVALDDALTDPASMRAIIDYLNHPAVKAVMDTAERQQRLGAIASTVNALPGDSGAVRTQDVPMWVRLGALSVITAWVAGTARTCMHAPVPDGPVPGWAVAWKPDLVVCPQCLHLLSTASDVEEFRCDCCGRISLEEDGGVAVATLANGSLLYRAGACPDCWTGFDAAVSAVGA